MNREKLDQLGTNFATYIAPLLDDNVNEDYHFLWEFQKFFHAKKLQVMTAKQEEVKKWKASLLTR
jgi:hypothetical protein